MDVILAPQPVIVTKVYLPCSGTSINGCCGNCGGVIGTGGTCGALIEIPMEQKSLWAGW